MLLYHLFSGVAMPTKPQTKDSASKYFFSSRLGNYVGEMLIQPKPNPLPLILSASSILIEIHWHRILGAYHAHHAFFFARPLLSITFKPGRKKGSNFLSFLLFFFTYVIPVTLRWSYTWSRQSWVLLCSSPAPKLYALCLSRIFLI